MPITENTYITMEMKLVLAEREATAEAKTPADIPFAVARALQKHFQIGRMQNTQVEMSARILRTKFGRRA